jgi:HlyD family secretion protein
MLSLQIDKKSSNILFMIRFFGGLVLIVCLLSCSNGKRNVDAFGSFEAKEVMISTQAEGMLLAIFVEEGQKIGAGDAIAVIDTTQWVAQRKQIDLQLDAFWIMHTNIPKKFKELNDSLVVVEKKISRIGNISAVDTAKKNELQRLQIEKKDWEEKIAKEKKNYASSVKLLANQAEQLYLQLIMIHDAICKCTVTSPINGIVLTKYANQFELTGKGYPLVRIADLSRMTLKVYVSEDQLSALKLGGKCTVRIDQKKHELKEYKGILAWIASESEFTPKMIQTKDERVNLVYAVKIRVKNDGSIKIGMPGEVVFE